jgi:hypothetical protein
VVSRRSLGCNVAITSLGCAVLRAVSSLAEVAMTGRIGLIFFCSYVAQVQMIEWTDLMRDVLKILNNCMVQT